MVWIVKKIGNCCMAQVLLEYCDNYGCLMGLLVLSRT
jgi:hypothetical protein